MIHIFNTYIRRPILASSVLESNKLAATRYPLPNTHLPNTQYPNTQMPNTENIKMPKYLMIQNIKIPGCSRGPRGLGRFPRVSDHDPIPFLTVCLGPEPWPWPWP